MISCPICHHEELFGTLFCSECGTELYHLKVSPPKTRSYDTPKGQEGAAQQKHTTEGEAEPHLSSTFPSVSLVMLETGQVIPLDEGDEFTLGRISGSQPILPDIDLTPFKAYEGGVSRLHATIRINNDQVYITDLGSANGTRINGKKIPAHQPHLLNHEDIITLGKFKTQILVQKR